LEKTLQHTLNLSL